MFLNGKLAVFKCPYFALSCTRDLPGKCSGNDGAISQKIDAAVKNVISFNFPTSLY